MTPTNTQVAYVLALLDQHGYSTLDLDWTFSQLGVPIRRPSGTAEERLRSMSQPEISRLSDLLRRGTA